MLNKVSLLPQEYLNRIAQKEKYKKIMLITIAIVAVIAIAAVSILGCKIYLTFSLSHIKAENVTQSEKVASLAEYEKMGNEMSANRKIISDIMATNNEWMSKIYQTTEKFPRVIAINKIETFIETNQCVIVCNASTYGEVSDLIADLENVEVIENVKCETLNSDGQQVSFQLTVDYVGEPVLDSTDSESTDSPESTNSSETTDSSVSTDSSENIE